MDLERGEQNRIYKEIWIPIENNCKVSDGSEITSYVSDFIRDYLTLKTEKISSKPKVFETFKTYYEKENDEKLEDMKKYSEAYSYIIKPGLEKDKDIQRELENLNSLDKTVINTFLIGIIKDYKDEILERYLNEIYFGSGSYGIRNASEQYFKKDVKDLNIAESALLAGIPNRPTKYDPNRNLENALHRQRIILKEMYDDGKITKEQYEHDIDSLYNLKEKVEKVLEHSEKVEKVAAKILNQQSIFYLGRGLDYMIAVEGALKSKEISYIHSEAFASGELKHGTIALIDEGVPVVINVTQSDLFDKSVSNIKEVVARGAYVIAVAKEGNTVVEEVADEVFYIPDVEDDYAGFLSIIIHQLLAYYLSKLKGNDVDKPRNLAKSVTVE